MESVVEEVELENLIRALLNDVLTGQEEERRRIARELHEETAQTLASLLVGLAALEGSQAQAAAGILRTSVSAALAGVKRISRGLRPSILDDLGLEQALEGLAVEASPAGPFTVDLQVTGPRAPRLDDAVEIALYRIAQEALANAEKHAAPRAVSVLIHRSANAVRLVIEDDGSGFDVGAVLSGAQLGLLGMRERAHLIGGAMTVESSKGLGTTVCVTVPLPLAVH